MLKVIFSLFGILVCFTKVISQTTLNGTVYLYKEKGNNTPLEGVNIKAPSGGSQMTEKNGTYSFAFDNQVSVITLQARKIGYEVINEEEIKALELAKKRQQHIYFDVEGNTRKRERELLDAALAQRSKLRDGYYAILEKGGKEADLLKLKLEKEAGKTFRDFDELKGYIYDKYGADSKTLESIIPSIIRLNLDHSNKEVKKMKEYVLKGMVDSVVMLLDLPQRYIHVENRINSIAVLQAKNDLDKQIIKASIPGLLLNGRYAAIDSCYDLIIKIDTTDLVAYFQYAHFLQLQNNFSKSKHFYDIVLKKYRLLATQSPQAYEPYLASTLDNLGILLKDIKQYQQARQYSQEALQIYRRLTTQSPKVYEPDLAVTLMNLADLLRNLREYPEAQQYSQEALQIFRRLATQSPQVYEPFVAMILHNFGNLLSNLWEYPEAVKYYQEALQIKRRLAIQSPQVYEPDLAMTLMNLGELLQKLQEYPGALQHSREALQIYRRLAAQNPQVYEPHLAGTLTNLGTLLRDINEYQGARQYYQEALQMFGHMSAQSPQAYEFNVAMIFYNMGMLSLDLQEYSEARQYYQEALQIYRRLATQNPEVHEPYAAMTLNALGVLLRNLREYPEARQHSQEALQIRRRLAAQNPQAYEPDLAVTLYGLGNLLRDINEYPEARQYYQQALQIRRRLATQKPKVYEPDLAATLTNLGNLLRDIKEYQEARQYYQEALQIYRRLATQSPQTYESHVAGTLNNLGILLKDIKGYPEARQYYQQALQIYRRLATQSPQAYEPDLAVTLNNLGDLLLIEEDNAAAAQSYRELLNLQLLQRLSAKDTLTALDHLNTTVGKLAGLYNKTCSKDSAIYYYSLTLTYSDSIIQQIQTFRARGLDNATMKYYYSFYNGNASWYALHARKYRDAVQYAQQAITTDSSQQWVNTNLAHGLLLAGDYAKAETLYKKIKRKTYEQDSTKTYAQVLLEDLKSLECSGAIPKEREADVEKIKGLILKGD